MIDARTIFGNKFIMDQKDKSLKETNDRMKEMGPAFIRMIGDTLREKEKNDV